MVLTASAILGTVLYYRAPQHLRDAWQTVGRTRVYDNEHWQDSSDLLTPAAREALRIEEEAQIRKGEFERQMSHEMKANSKALVKEKALKKQAAKRVAAAGRGAGDAAALSEEAAAKFIASDDSPPDLDETGMDSLEDI